MALAGIRFDRKICALLYKTVQALKWKPINKKIFSFKPMFCSNLAVCWGVKGSLCGVLGRSKETPDRRWPKLCPPCTETAPSWASPGVPSTPWAFFQHLLDGSTRGSDLRTPCFFLASGQTPGVPIGFGRRFEVSLPPLHLWALHGRTESVFDSANGAREGTLGAGGQGEREELTWAQPWCHSALHQPSQTLNPMSTRKTVRTSYMDHIPLSPTLKQF